MAIAVTVLATCVLAPRSAGAQESRIDELVDEASNHYDMLEIGPAKEKLEQAVGLAKENGITGEPLARAYIMTAVVNHGAEKDEQAAQSSFEDAVRADPDVEIPDVYRTPELEKLMRRARDNVDISESEQEETGSEADASTDGDGQREVEEFTHEPTASAQAGEPLKLEAIVPASMPVETVNCYYQRYDQDDWSKVTLEPSSATKFTGEIPGYEIYTSQVAYYLEAVDASANTVATSGDRRGPHTVTVLGAASFDHEQAKKEAMEDEEDDDDDDVDTSTTDPDDEDDEDESGVSSPIVYLDFGGGTGAGVLTRYSDTTRPPPTANPGRELDAGVAPAFGHANFGIGAVINETSTLGLYFRWQFSPAQSFDDIRRNSSAEARRLYSGFQNGECLGTGLPGDCLLGAKYRWFFSNGPDLRIFSAIGAGVGRVRHWVRLKERAESDFCQNPRNNKTIFKPADQPNFCYRSDTVRPGWMHFGLGGGVTYEINDVFALMGEAYLEILFPDTAVNLDINIGPQFRF